MSQTATLGKDVRRSLAFGIANNVALRIGNLLVGILLAHLLAPSAFGIFAVALTILAILANFTDLGMTAYLVRVGDIDKRAPTVLTLGLTIGGVLAAAMWAMAPMLASFMGSPQATSAVQVLALTLVLSGASSVPAALLQRRFQQGRQLIADGGSFVVGTAVVLPLTLAGFGAMSLAWSRVLGQVAALALLCYLTRYRLQIGFDKRLARQALKFGAPLGGANLLSWLLLNADFVLVGRALGATSLGYYVLAFNISSWPTSALAQGLRAVSLPGFSQVRNSGPHDRNRQFSAAAGLTMAAAAPVGLLLVALAAPLVVAVYGERWTNAIAPLAALAAFGAFRPLFDLSATYLTARNRTRWVFGIQIIWTGSLLLALWLGIHLGGLTGAGLAHLVVAFAVVVPAYLVAVARDEISVGRVVSSCMVPVAAALTASAVGFAATQVVDSSWTALMLGGSAAGLVYLLLVFRWVRRTMASFRDPEPEPHPVHILPSPRTTLTERPANGAAEGPEATRWDIGGVVT